MKKLNITVKKPNIKLSRREKIIVSAGTCFVTVFLFLYLVVFPFFSTRAKLRQGAEANQEKLKRIMAVIAQYQGLQKNSGGTKEILAKREEGFTLFSLLEGLAGEVGLKDRIKYIKPSSSETKGEYKTSSVEMQFERINMEELFGYLYRVEDPENIVRVKRISIKKHKDASGYVNATLQVLTIQSAKKLSGGAVVNSLRCQMVKHHSTI